MVIPKKRLIDDVRHCQRLLTFRADSGDVASRMSSLLELDLSKLPTKVNIKGNTLEFAIPARITSEITPLEPAVDDTVDLRTQFFRWSKIEGADYYRLMAVRKDSRVGDSITRAVQQFG
jgi:hypothetical protein